METANVALAFASLAMLDTWVIWKERNGHVFRQTFAMPIIVAAKIKNNMRQGIG